MLLELMFLRGGELALENFVNAGEHKIDECLALPIKGAHMPAKPVVRKRKGDNLTNRCTARESAVADFNRAARMDRPTYGREHITVCSGQMRRDLAVQ